jgi:hypothetical protein
MNRCKAAALALASWYLMLPPLTQTGPDTYNLPPDTSAPLSKWTYQTPRDRFDSEDECKEELKGRQELSARGLNRDAMMNRHGNTLGQSMSGYFDELQKAARCVPDTDPGTKRN